VCVVKDGIIPLNTGPPALQARQYMQMLPKEKQPVAGSEGAQYRKKQLAKQLPAHDQDPSKCHELSPKEVKEMEQFVKKYKSEALGVGDVKFPSEMNAQGDKVHNPAGNRHAPAAVASKDKSAESKKTQYVSSHRVDWLCVLWIFSFLRTCLVCVLEGSHPSISKRIR
jgi:hypothetical protein